MRKFYTCATALFSVKVFRVMAMVLVILSVGERGWGQTNNYFGTSGTLSANVWSTNPAGPYTSALVSTGGPILNFNNPGSATGASIATTVGINFGATVTWTPGGTIGAAGINLPINIANGVEHDFGSSQSFSNSATSAFTKNGAGTLAMTGNTFGGGFTMNAGTFIVRGVNAMGAGALTINGGIIAANSNRDLTGKYTGGINIGGNFTIGATTGLALSTANLTFSNNIILGAGTSRIITLGGTGTYLFGGIISGVGSSLTISNTAAGFLRLGGANTYNGGTTLSGGTLQLGSVNTLPSTGTFSLDGGTLQTGSGPGFSQSAGPLGLTETSIINLGTGSHTLAFAASSGISWTTGKTITINNWLGTIGGSTPGTSGRIFVGSNSNGLTCAQLSQIQFVRGSVPYPAAILSTGEIVPINTPTITSINPSFTTVGGGPFTITVSGTNFVPGLSTTTWNGSTRTTTFVDNATLTATINAADISSIGTANVGVTTGCTTSNTQTFTINTSALPTLTTNATAGSITTTSASLGGNVTTTGSSAITNIGVVYSLTATNATPSILGTGVTNEPGSPPATGSFSILTGAVLAPNTQYSYRAYASNDNGGSYAYGSSTGTTFYTLANVPPTPTVNGATSVSLNVTIDATDNPANTEFAIFETTTGKYVQADGTLGATAVWQTAAVWGTKTVMGLTSSTAYTFSVKAKNGSNVETAASLTASGTTTACSSIPTNLTITNISNSGASISWTSATNTDYEYSVITSATPPASGITIVSTTSDFVSGLSSATNYYLHVRSKCGTNYSGWATSDPFTTDDAPSGLITWVPLGLSNYGPSPWTPTTSNTRLIVSGFTRGTGVTTTPTSAANAWGGNKWTGAVTEDATFTVEAIAGYKVSYSSISLSYRKSGTGPTSGKLQYAIGSGGFTDITTYNFSSSSSSGATLPTTSLTSITELQNVPNGTVIKFRILPSGGVSGGTWYIYNEGLILNGLITPTINPPIATAATLINPGCFTANWGAVTGATNYFVDVYTSGFSVDLSFTSVAAWDFSTNLNTTSGIALNNNIPVAAVNTTNPAAIVTQTARADGWDGGNGNKYWETHFATTGYYNIRLSSKQRSSGTGPKDFKLQYKIGLGGTYVDVTGGSVVVLNDYISGVLSNIALPSTCDDKPAVYVKWIMTSNSAVTSGSVASGGASNIDDIEITGNAGTNTLYVTNFQNKSVGNVTSTQIIGLSPATLYSYVVRAVVSGVTSSNSNIITVTTTDQTTADYRSKQTGNYSAASTWEYDPGCNATWVQATVAPGSTNNVTILTGHSVTVDNNPLIGNGKTLTVNSGGVIILPASSIVSGAGAFTLSSGATLQTANVLGIIASASSGSIQVGGTRTYDGGATYVYNGSANQITGNGLPATITGLLTINNTGAVGNNTVTLTTGNTTVSTLNLNGGLFAAGTAQQLNISVSGTVNGNNGNWSSASSAGTLNFNGGGTVNPGAGLLLTNVNLNGSVNMGAGNTTVRGLLDIKANGSIQNGRAPTYSSSPASTLQYSCGCTYTANEEWYPNTFGTSAGVPHHVVLATGTSLSFGGNAFSRELRGDLTINNVSTFTLSSASGGNLNIKGSFINNGTFAPNGRLVIFNGSASQSIQGSTTFSLLEVKQTPASTLILNSPITIVGNGSSALSLTSGIVTTTSINSLTITNTAIAAVSGGGALAFINGPVTWQLPSGLGSNAFVFKFPVGKLLPSTKYMPFSITSPVTTAAPSITVEAFSNGYSGSTFDNTKISALSEAEYWIASTTAGLTTATVGLTRPANIGSLNSIATAPALGGTFTYLGGTQNGLYTIDNSSGTSLSDTYFTMAAAIPAPAITSMTASGYTGEVITLGGSNLTGTNAVIINGIAATNVTVVNAGQVTATVGVGLPATGFITVTTPAGSFTTSGTAGTFTYLGYITKANAEWNTSTTWLGEVLPPAGAVVTVANEVAVNTSMSNVFDTVSVSSGGKLTFAPVSNLSVNNIFTNNGIVDMTSGGTITMAANSSFTSNGGVPGFIGGTGAVIVNGSSTTTATVNGAFNLHDITVNGGVNFTGNAGINGTFLINPNGFVNTNAPKYNTNSILKYGSGSYNRTSEWGSLSGAGYPYHVQISNNTTFNAGGTSGSNANIPLNMAGNLTIDAGSNFYMDVTDANMTVPLKVVGNILINGALSASGTVGGDIEVGKNWTNTGTFNPNNRTVTFNGTGTQTITKTGGETFDFVTIDKTAGTSVVLASAVTTNKTLSISSGKLQLGSNLLTINGPFVASAANSLTGSKTANLILGTGYSGTLYFDQSSATGNYLNTFRLLNNATVATKLKIAPSRFDDGANTGYLRVAIGKKLTLQNTADTLTLTSDETGTARIAAGDESGNYIDGAGAVAVERYIPEKRAWRLLTAPITSSNVTINKAWQEGQVSNLGANLLAGSLDSVSPLPGYGTHITGGTFAPYLGNPTLAMSDGYDVGFTVPGTTSSIRVYSTNGSGVGNFNKSAKPLSTKISDSAAYFLFVRGDRYTNLAGGTGAATTNTILRAGGSVRMGTNTISKTQPGTFSLIGNPFPSPIDFETIVTNSANSLQQRFWIWDARLATFGGFTLIRRNNANVYDSIPANIQADSGKTSNLQFIQSGQGFFVEPVNATLPLIIREADKAVITKTNVFNSANRRGASMFVSLYQLSGTSTNLTDGVLAAFDENYSSDIDKDDVGKPARNLYENVDLRRHGKNLTVEARPQIVSVDTLFLNLSGMASRNYQFKTKGLNFSPGLSAVFVDNFLRTSIPIDIDGGITSMNFAIGDDAASRKEDRFMIVFRPAATLPINFTNVKAYQKNADIQVEWNLGNESSISRYEVEKSTDGRTFTKTAGQALRTLANSNQPYNWLDVAASKGNNYYRIKAIEQSGEYKYSQVVNVKIDGGAGGISVYPNPVKANTMSLQFVNQPKGKYTLKLLNSLGQEVYRGEISHMGGSSTETVQLNDKLASGVYQLSIQSTRSSSTQQVIYE